MKNFKKIIVPAIAAIALCISLIAGATYAWFTDEAKTNVNKIQSGKLDVALEMSMDNGATWTTAEGQTLSFLKMNAEGELTADANILWEPGCTYKLPLLRVINNGNLALKYKVVLSGATGDLNLLEAISFTANITKDGADTATTMTGAYGSVLAESMLKPEIDGVKSFDTIALEAKMDENAGNEYMELAVNNISVTVYAMQAVYESDSTGSDYDKDASGNWEDFSSASATVTAGGNTVLKDNGETPSVTLTAPEGSTAATQLTLTKMDSATSSNIEVITGTKAVSAEFSLVDENGDKVTAAEGKFFTLTMQLDKNANVLAFYHYETALTKANSLEELTANDMYYYDAATGVLTFTTDDFSPFTVVTSESIYNGGNGTAAAPYLIATGEQACEMENHKGYFKFIEDVVVTDEIYLSGKTVVIDLNGHSVKLEYADGVKPNNGSVFYIGGKKGNLTINDSSKAQTGAVIGSDKTYTNKVTSAVRAGNYGKLTINGGHFYGTSEGTSCIFVYTSMSSGSKATVVINGGKFETATPSGGTYFVLNHQDNATAGCTITVNGGSFKNYNPGVTTVDPVNAKTGKILLGEGCTTTSKEVGGVTWYTVSK